MSSDDIFDEVVNEITSKAKKKEFDPNPTPVWDSPVPVKQVRSHVPAFEDYIVPRLIRVFWSIALTLGIAIPILVPVIDFAMASHVYADMKSSTVAIRCVLLFLSLVVVSTVSLAFTRVVLETASVLFDILATIKDAVRD